MLGDAASCAKSWCLAQFAPSPSARAATAPGLQGEEDVVPSFERQMLGRNLRENFNSLLALILAVQCCPDRFIALCSINVMLSKEKSNATPRRAE